MEITWLGHSCFRIKGKGGSVITDPFGEGTGYHLGKVTADIVTVSHDHPGHNFVQGIGGNPKVISKPGEYEIAGIFIYGMRTYHDPEKGQIRGKNTCFLMEIDDVRVAHLGDLGHTLSAAQADELNDADILLIPVGGKSTIDAPAAAEIVHLLNPKIVIPMHYKTEIATADLDTASRFLSEMGAKDLSPMPKFTGTKGLLPAETQVIVLNYR